MRRLSYLLIMFAIFFASCEGPMGPIGEKGPQGEKGDAGNDGTNGTNGTNGTDGEDGVANIANYSINVAVSDWTYNSTYQTWYYDYTISETNSNSLVYGYVMSGMGKQALPYHQKTSYSDEEFTFAGNLFSNPQFVQLQYSNYDSPTTKPTSSKNYYLIIVPPVGNKANIDYSDYDAVIEYYGLEE